MPSPDLTPTSSDRDRIARELTSSLTSIWRRHSGGEPSSATTELSNDCVKLVLEDAVSGIGQQGDDADASPDAAERSPNTHGYKTEAIAAVRRITGRNVVGYVPKRNRKTDVATDTYLLERRQVTY